MTNNNEYLQHLAIKSETELKPKKEKMTIGAIKDLILSLFFR